MDQGQRPKGYSPAAIPRCVDEMEEVVRVSICFKPSPAGEVEIWKMRWPALGYYCEMSLHGAHERRANFLEYYCTATPGANSEHPKRSKTASQGRAEIAYIHHSIRRNPSAGTLESSLIHISQTGIILHLPTPSLLTPSSPR